MIFIIEISCLFVASFFAGMETGLLSADKLKIYAKKEKGKLWAKSAHFLLKKPERLLATTLIGTNAAVVTSTVVLNNYLRNRYSMTISIVGSLLLATIYLLFSEIIPKTFFRRYADTVTVRLATILRVLFYAFLPVSFFLNIVVRIFMLVLGQKNTGDKLPRSRDDFRLLMHLSSRESGFGYDDFRTIDDILDFGLTIASEAMVPLHCYSIIKIDTTPKDILRESVQLKQRFFPCYRDRSDNIIGFIDVEDFCDPKNISLEQILKVPIFFPEVKPLSDLLYTMVERALKVVFLCDEYGGISGIITQQQIASEIIGAIPGNLHTIKEDVIFSGKNIFIAAGKTDLEYLSHVINLKIRKGNNQTLGGYLCERLGVIPEIGAEFIDGLLKYTVLDADKLYVRKVKIEVLVASIVT
ncbi:MAG: CNNM domain-containing protein [Spirochaetaceae bacterium]|jgi:putative hemolysin|nr:CNNM domain-containing protein [Spirochaetaceae bacterium]